MKMKVCVGPASLVLGVHGSSVRRRREAAGDGVESGPVERSLVQLRKQRGDRAAPVSSAPATPAPRRRRADSSCRGKGKFNTFSPAASSGSGRQGRQQGRRVHPGRCEGPRVRRAEVEGPAVADRDRVGRRDRPAEWDLQRRHLCRGPDTSVGGRCRSEAGKATAGGRENDKLLNIKDGSLPASRGNTSSCSTSLRRTLQGSFRPSPSMTTRPRR